MRKLVSAGDKLERLGQVVTCDHIIANSEMKQSIEGHTCAVVFYDLCTQFLGAYPSLTKTAAETHEWLKRYKGTAPIEYMYSDNSDEIEIACRLEHIIHDTCQPGDKQANGIAERQVQEVKLGTAANLEQAWMPHAYW